jgi:hypothetical protein
LNFLAFELHFVLDPDPNPNTEPNSIMVSVSLRQKVPVPVEAALSLALLPVEREEADGEAEGVEHLVLHGGEEDVQLLRLRRDGAGTQVRVPSYRPE